MSGPDSLELILRRLRDADQRAEYHMRRTLEWTDRAHRLWEELRSRLAREQPGTPSD